MIMLADPFHRRANKNVNFKYTLRLNHGLEWIHTRRRCLLLLLSISQTDVQSPRRPRPSTPAFLAFETKDDEETKTRTPINMCTAATQSTLWSYLNLSFFFVSVAIQLPVRVPWSGRQPGPSWFVRSHPHGTSIPCPRVKKSLLGIYCCYWLYLLLPGLHTVDRYPVGRINANRSADYNVPPLLFNN